MSLMIYLVSLKRWVGRRRTACPRLKGCISRKANTLSLSKSFRDGISPIYSHLVSLYPYFHRVCNQCSIIDQTSLTHLLLFVQSEIALNAGKSLRQKIPPTRQNIFSRTLDDLAEDATCRCHCFCRWKLLYNWGSMNSVLWMLCLEKKSGEQKDEEVKPMMTARQG